MTTQTFTVKGMVELFPQKGGWHFVRVPKTKTRALKHKTHWGLIPVTAQVGDTSWNTSLLPMGDGTHFIALNAQVRKKEGMVLGEQATVQVTLRC